MFWLDPKHNLFPLKGPLLNDPNTFFILLFLINSAPFSLRGLDFGTCVCRSLGRGPRLTGFGQGVAAKRRHHESVVYRIIYLSIYLSVHLSTYLSLSLSIYLSIERSFYLCIYLSIYLHRQAGKTFGACGRPEKHPLDRGHGASIGFARAQEPYADMYSTSQASPPKLNPNSWA